MTHVAPDQSPPSLATLRDDLKLTQGPPLENGSPTWTLHDPVRNLFFRIGWQEFIMLNHWKKAQPDTLLETINQTTTLLITSQDITLLNDFLKRNLLVVPDSKEALELIKARIKKKKPGTLTWLLKNYLFFRLPLFKPDHFLDTTLPFARLFISRPFLYLLTTIGLLGLFLTLRQWESFIHTFLYFFSTQGLILYGLAIFLSKLLHELGHAYTSKYYGLHVPTMGIAFLVLWPVLYSDNSEAWRIKSRSSRVHIVAAGTLVELALALIATFLWSFLSDGPLRSACFVTATVTWISSVLINMSPFLRFDGYYLLSDLWEMPNLHTRAFVLGKWQMRKFLLGLKTPCPENLPLQKRRLLIFFAYFTWIYRLILFTGIALLVYNFFFKLLGVTLFILEVIWFIALPIYKELFMWWKKRTQIGINSRVLLTFLGLATLIVLLLVPLNTKVNVPGLMKPGVPYRIYPQFSARIQKITVSDGSSVKQGALLFEFDSPHLDFQISNLQIKVEMLTIQLKRYSQKTELIEQQHVIQQRLTSSLTELQGYLKQKQQLKITAPADGVIKDMAVGLVRGKWVNSNDFLAVLVKTDETVLEGYPNEHQLARISPNDQARFYPESGDYTPIPCRVNSINKTSSRILDEPYLASLYGGDLPVRMDKDKLISDQSLYRVLLIPQASELALPAQVHRGTIVINGIPQSIALRALRKVTAVFIRESGF